MSANVGESYNEQILQATIDGEPYVNENPYPSRIEILLMELKEAIEQGSGDVDQNYNPTSENAQSGVAVAQAVAAGKIKKIFSETFSYQWLATGTDLVIPFTKTVTMKNKTLYLVVIYESHTSNAVMGSIFMTKGLGPLASVLRGRTSIPYYDNPNIVTGLASILIVSGSHPSLTLLMPTISAASGDYTGRLEIYEVGFE